LYTIEEIRVVAVLIAQRYGVSKLALFGSYAKNTATPESDIDFLVDARNIVGYFGFAGFIQDLEDSLGVHIDVVEYDAASDSFMERVANDEVTLYE
jgi:predicted nucleotidyltransferase